MVYAEARAKILCLQLAKSEIEAVGSYVPYMPAGPLSRILGIQSYEIECSNPEDDPY